MFSDRVQTKKDIEDTKERVKYALQHVDDPVPHKRRRRTNNNGEGNSIAMYFYFILLAKSIIHKLLKKVLAMCNCS